VTAAIVDEDSLGQRCSRRREVSAVGEQDVKIAIAVDIAEGELVAPLRGIGTGGTA